MEIKARERCTKPRAGTNHGTKHITRVIMLLLITVFIIDVFLSGKLGDYMLFTPKVFFENNMSLLLYFYIYFCILHFLFF